MARTKVEQSMIVTKLLYINRVYLYMHGARRLINIDYDGSWSNVYMYVIA